MIFLTIAGPLGVPELNHSSIDCGWAAALAVVALAAADVEVAAASAAVVALVSSEEVVAATGGRYQG